MGAKTRARLHAIHMLVYIMDSRVLANATGMVVAVKPCNWLPLRKILGDAAQYPAHARWRKRADHAGMNGDITAQLL